MKLIVQVLFVAAMSYSLEALKMPAVGSGELAKDFNDFLKLVPMKQALQVIKAYTAQDEEFQTSMAVMSLEEVRALVYNVEEAPQVSNMLYFMQNAGLDVYYILKRLHAHMNFLNSEVPSAVDAQISGGLAGLERDLKALVPLEQVKALLQKKVAAGGAFAQFYKLWNNNEFRNYYSNLHRDVHVRVLVRIAELAHVNGVMFEKLFPVLLAIRHFAG
ncbi:protein G12-like [Nomia melanderi]|uniref:protein G12-like n=1 Tax=Nomia melanderi TaxID=2448451 RepID=UPI00130430F6|nr:uncharacterized protein LOC116425072 [Nomia melanderi]